MALDRFPDAHQKGPRRSVLTPRLNQNRLMMPDDPNIGWCFYRALCLAADLVTSELCVGMVRQRPRNFALPVDFSPYSHVWIRLDGEMLLASSAQEGLIPSTTEEECIFEIMTERRASGRDARAFLERPMIRRHVLDGKAFSRPGGKPFAVYMFDALNLRPSPVA